jgi:dynein heavy chain
MIHGSVQEACHQFFNERKRRVYLTPKTFLDALAQFDEQLNRKTQEMTLRLMRLRNGLNKLDVTKKQIAELKIKLTELVPQLQEENE